MGILEVLTIIFVVMKLLEVIDWSWWLVFAPMFVYPIVFALWLMFAFVVALIGGVAEGMSKRK